MPKKDQCPLCNTYKRLVQDGTVQESEENVVCNELLQDEEINGREVIDIDCSDFDNLLESATKNLEEFVAQYKAHKKREYDALEMRDADKLRAQSNQSVRAISFDLEAILQCPFAAENQTAGNSIFTTSQFTMLPKMMEFVTSGMKVMAKKGQMRLRHSL